MEKNYRFSSALFNRSSSWKHLIAWALFIVYEVLFILTTVGIHSSFADYIVYYILNISLFYFHAHVVLDYAFFSTRSPWLFTILFILAEALIYILIKFGIDLIMAEPKPTWEAQARYALTFTVRNLWRGIYFIGMSSGYFAMLYFRIFQEMHHQAERQRSEAVAQQLRLEYNLLAAENAYLQSQVSPHLLFNTLNFIYRETYRLSDRAGQGILILSDLLHYSLAVRQTAAGVPLHNEIHQIEQLLRIDHLRFQDERNVSLQWDGSGKDFLILPMLLVSFAENMMKHGDLSDPLHPGIILISVGDGMLRFQTWNRKNKHRSELSLGTGLPNARKRAVNAYEDHFQLEILESDEDYMLTFSLYL